MNDISLPILTPQTTSFGFINRLENSKRKKYSQTNKINKWKNEKKLLEQKSAQTHIRKLAQYNIKWEKIHRIIKT